MISRVKKVLAVCLIFMLTACMLNFPVTETKAEDNHIEYYDGIPVTPKQIDGDYADYGLSEEYDGYYAISNASELYGFAELVNNGNVDVNGVLINNIYVNNTAFAVDEDGYVTNDVSFLYTWNPIGGYNKEGSSNSYGGSFDGLGHSINGLYYYDEEMYDSCALFYNVNGGIIKNVNIENSCLIGGVVASIAISTNYKGAIENCYSSAYLGARIYLGGIAEENNGKISNCEFSGQLIKGIKFTSEDVSTIGYGIPWYAGSISCTNSGNINNCSNTLDINAYWDAGGITVYNHKGTISNCKNSGNISTNYTCAGGIAASDVASESTIEYCNNTGNVTGSRCGGIVGEGQNSQILNCISGGKIIGDYKYAGGIIGYCINSSTIKNCAYDYRYSDNADGCIVLESEYVDEDDFETGTGGIIGYGVYQSSSYNSSDCIYVENCYVNLNLGDDNDNYNNFSIIGYRDSYVNIQRTNCYYCGEIRNWGIGITWVNDTQSTKMSAEDFASGEVTYLLNEGTTDGTQAWYQNVDNGEATDGFPTLDSTHGAVYEITSTMCDGTSLYSLYTNNSAKQDITRHDVNGGICTLCGNSSVWAQSATKTVDGETTLSLRFVGATESKDYNILGFNVQTYMEKDNGEIVVLNVAANKPATKIYDAVKANGNLITANDLIYTKGYLNAYVYRKIPITGTYYFAVAAINSTDSEGIAVGTYKYYKVANGKVSVITGDSIPSEILVE